MLFFQKKNKVKIDFKEDLNYGVNDYKIEFKSKTNKLIDTIQTEKILKNDNNIIKFEKQKKNYKKSYSKNPKKKIYKKYKKKTK